MAKPPPSSSEIIIEHWSPEWATKFAKKGALIRSALGISAIRIDHIGSTSITGLAAKPIIDIQVSVADFADVELAGAMASAGYLWRRDNPELTKRYFRERPGEERTHIHIRRLGSWHEQWALLFRDYMRAHFEATVEYANLKRRLADRHKHNGAAYTDAKGDYFWSVMRQADLWAWETGWRPGPSDA